MAVAGGGIENWVGTSLAFAMRAICPGLYDCRKHRIPEF